TFWAPVIAPGELQCFGEVEGGPIRVLFDLRSAAESVGEYERVGRGGAHRGKKLALSARDRDVVVAALEAEVAGQAAAPGIEDLEIEADGLEQTLVGSGVHDSMVVT